jgi:hypothetical protein
MFSSSSPVDQLVDLAGLFTLNIIENQLYVYLDIYMDKNHWKFKKSPNFLKIKLTQHQIEIAYYCTMVTSSVFVICMITFVGSLSFRCEDMGNLYSIHSIKNTEDHFYAFVLYFCAVFSSLMMFIFAAPFVLLTVVQWALNRNKGQIQDDKKQTQ